MDAILHHLRNPGMMLPCKYQPAMASYGRKVVRNGFRPSTVGAVMDKHESDSEARVFRGRWALQESTSHMCHEPITGKTVQTQDCHRRAGGGKAIETAGPGNIDSLLQGQMSCKPRCHPFNVPIELLWCRPVCHSSVAGALSRWL